MSDGKLKVAMPQASQTDPIRFTGEPERTIRDSSTRGRPPLSPTVLQAPVPAAMQYRHASVALHNLRGLAIAFLLMLHSSLAYLGSVHASSYSFDRPPYGWLAYPILDRDRWLGFDFCCAWQDLYLMGLMFFLSGVFTWPSLSREGGGKYFSRRLVRLGPPLVLGVMVIMPVALYPVYRMTAPNPSLFGYLHEYLALPFVPIGPMWFLWMLLALNAIAAGTFGCWPSAASTLGRLSDNLARHPKRFLGPWLLVAIAAYVPLALVFTPWSWAKYGPFGIQLSRPLLYSAYYFAGVAVGIHGLGRGVLSETGVAARSWKVLFAAAGVSFVLWLGLTALAVQLGEAAPLLLNVAADASYPLAGSCSLLFLLAICLRFGTGGRWPVFAILSDNALWVYALHYAPVVWLQYALLGASWPASIKWIAVLLGVAALCLGATAGARQIRVRATARLPPGRMDPAG
jgi:Acyltransferase family